MSFKDFIIPPSSKDTEVDRRPGWKSRARRRRQMERGQLNRENGKCIYSQAKGRYAMLIDPRDYP